MRHTVSMIPYANVAPYRLLGAPPGIEFRELVPSASVEALLSGEVVAACVPVGALPALGETVELLGEFGIAAETAVGSVLLFSQLPLQAVRRPLEISLTSQSATSIRLLYLVLGYTNGFDTIPFVTDDRARASAVLLIGDDALRRREAGRDAHVIDLVTEWYRVHGKPFVFARWVVRKDAPFEIRSVLLSWLNGLKGRDDDFILQCAATEADKVGIFEQEMIRYLRGMQRILDAEALEGQQIFLNELEARVPETLFSRKPELDGGDPCGLGGGIARTSQAAALRLLRSTPLGTLMGLAHEARMARHRSDLVTFVRDTNPNYTNICSTKCRFCAFCRDADDDDAYTLSPLALAEKVLSAREQGACTVLLQGGNNPSVSLADWVAYIRAIRSANPDIHIHPFSPPEIWFMAPKEGLSIESVLSAIKDEGVDTMPGGGAEILSNGVRKQLAPKKCSADEWLEVMETAHRLGFRTTATMMFGHAERDEDIVEHLFRLRDLQDRTGGFSSFIPWSFKPGNSKLSERFAQAAHPARYVRIIAVARLVLDNFSHIQSSWFSESERAGMLGLLAGADDFGGTLIEENVLKTSGYERRTTEDRVCHLIRQAGFRPAVRDSHYRIKEILDAS